jgi:hypothetical protein
MAPVVHGLEAEYYDTVNFAFLDIENPDNNNFKQALGYRVQPHFFLLDAEGNIIEQWIGSVSAETFREAFDENLAQ